MSKKQKEEEAVAVSPDFTEEEINESFDKALKDGTLTDIMGNPMTKEDLVEETINHDPESVKIPFSRALNIMKGLQGKILTIVDASYDDKERAKYVKDLMKDAFAHQASWLLDLSLKLEDKTAKNVVLPCSDEKCHKHK